MMKLLNRWWLLFFAAALPFERIPSLNAAISGHVVTLRITLLLVAIGVLVFGRAAFKYLVSNIKLSSPWVWLGLYLAVVLISLVESINKPQSVIALIGTIATVVAAVLVAYKVQSVRLKNLYRVLALTTTVVCLFGFYQFAGDSFGLSTSLTGLRDIYTKAVFGFPRVQSTSLEPLFFGNFLLLPLFLTIAFIGTGLITAKKYLALATLFVMLLAMTLSRGAIAGMVIGIFLCALILWRYLSPSGALKIAGVTILGASLALGSIYSVNRINHKDGGKAVTTYVNQSTKVAATTTSSDSDRVVNRRLAIKAFHERPVFGYGLGSFGAYAQRSDPNLYPPSKGNATVNNEYLEILAETGLAGALALIGFVGALAYQGVRAFAVMNKEQRVWLAAAGVTLTAYLIQYYAFSTLYIMQIWFTVGLFIGLTTLPKLLPRAPSSLSKK